MVAGPIVETRAGKIRGEQVGGVAVFRGVQYGKPPIGRRRFGPPETVDPHTGVKDALTWGATCPQDPTTVPQPFRWYWSEIPMGEDCLTLNVFTPLPSPGGKRAVMVWLHGGSFSSSAASAPGFDGTNLARRGDVVVVTVNHRLNIFGFFHLGGDGGERFADSANAGQLDLVAALEWIRDNIAEFGGDPGNVTIFGESGGGGKVGRLMAMPAAKGLFHRAIIQSSPLRAAAAEDGVRSAHHVLEHLGLSVDTAHRLEDVPAEALLRARISTNKAFGVDYFQPVTDGRSLFEAPFHDKAPAESAGVPLLIGSNANETMFRLFGQPGIEQLTREQAVTRLEKFSEIGREDGDVLYEAYARERPGASPLEIYSDMMTDHRFRLNILHCADLKAKQGGAPAFLYRFAWKTPTQGGILKSPHTIEIPFIFDTLEAAADLVGTGEDLPVVRDKTMAIWVAFARKGDPNHDGLPGWRPYSAADPGTMVIDADPRFVSEPPRSDFVALGRFRNAAAGSAQI